MTAAAGSAAAPAPSGTSRVEMLEGQEADGMLRAAVQQHNPHAPAEPMPEKPLMLRPQPCGEAQPAHRHRRGTQARDAPLPDLPTADPLL